MTYQYELKKMIRHRRQYWPAMDDLVALFRRAGGLREPLDITGHRRVFLYLELVDIGYCKPEVIVAVKQFGEIKRVLYRGGDPFTDLGHRSYDERGLAARLATVVRRFAARWTPGPGPDGDGPQRGERS